MNVLSVLTAPDARPTRPREEDGRSGADANPFAAALAGQRPLHAPAGGNAPAGAGADAGSRTPEGSPHAAASGRGTERADGNTADAVKSGNGNGCGRERGGRRRRRQDSRTDRRRSCRRSPRIPGRRIRRPAPYGRPVCSDTNGPVGRGTGVGTAGRRKRRGRRTYRRRLAGGRRDAGRARERLRENWSTPRTRTGERRRRPPSRPMRERRAGRTTSGPGRRPC